MNQVVNYLVNERKNTPVVARQLFRVLSKYDDIYDEFLQWLQTRTYNVDNAICIEGYTAEDIYSLAPFMDGSGVYSFLVTLRDDPIQAKQVISTGFVRK